MSRRQTGTSEPDLPQLLIRADDALFAGPGPTRAALRTVDWSSTELGAVGNWPVDLVCAARTVVAASVPMLMWWGPGYHQFHNDAVLEAFGACRPGVGRPAKECWPEHWDALGPAARRVFAEGSPTHLDDVELGDSAGSASRWAVGFGALRAEDGRVVGVLASAVDRSARAEAERAQRRADDMTVANLQIALLTNRRIGVAVGILMAQRRITDEAAFDLLREASQRTHRKLRDIAEDVVLTGALPE